MSDAPTTGQAGPDLFERVPVQIQWRRSGPALVEFSGERFVKGFAKGDDCNCLIFTLRECLCDVGLLCVVDAPWVRMELRRRFRTGPDAVTERNYLDLRVHGPVVLDLIGESARANGCDPGRAIRAENFKMTCVAEDQRVVGEVVGEGRVDLFPLNEGLRHFVPLLRDRSAR